MCGFQRTETGDERIRGPDALGFVFSCAIDDSNNNNQTCGIYLPLLYMVSIGMPRPARQGEGNLVLQLLLV